MEKFKCTAYFCKWNKLSGVCAHSQAIEALEHRIPDPVAGCEFFEKISLRRKKNEKS